VNENKGSDEEFEVFIIIILSLLGLLSHLLISRWEKNTTKNLAIKYKDLKYIYPGYSMVTLPLPGSRISMDTLQIYPGKTYDLKYVFSTYIQVGLEGSSPDIFR